MNDEVLENVLKPGDGMERKLIIIVAFGVAGSGNVEMRSDVGAQNHFKSVRAGILVPAISRHDGIPASQKNNRALAVFTDPVTALQCATDIQTELAARNRLLGENHQVLLGVGIHLEEVGIDEGQMSGDGSTIVDQLQCLAGVGGVAISKPVYDQVAGKIQKNFVSLGTHTLNNVGTPFEAFRVVSDEKAGLAEIIFFGSFELDIARFELRKAGERIAIEPQAFDLIAFLATNSERTVSRDEILAKIWDNRAVSDAALSSQIKAARKVLEDDGNSQHTIRTIHGRGFRFVATIESPRTVLVSEKVVASLKPAVSEIAKMPSVAVLPLENLTGDQSEAYFADGITEDITTALSKNRWLAVVARNSAFAFRNSRDTMSEVGQKLEANYLVTGSVRKAGSRVRVSVQLVDAETGASMWSERFDSDIVDIFDLQDDITEMVASRIESELGLTEQRKAERRPRKNRGAWDIYQLGVAEFYKFTEESNRKSQEFLRQSIELDSELACAHSRLAYAIVLSMVYFDAAPEQARLDEALKAARLAIVLDDQDAASYFTIGRVYLARRDYDLAIDALEQAIKLNPCLAVTYCGLGDSLAYEGRLDEAIEQFDIAMRLSPHDPFRWAFFSYRSLVHLFRQEFAEAVVWARKSVQVPNAQYWSSAHLVAALGHLGDTEQASNVLKDLIVVKPEFSLEFARTHLFYLKREDQMEIYISGLEKGGVT